MVHLMLGAFFAASFAGVGTEQADGLRLFTAACHGGRSKFAYLRAVDVQGDAAGHHLDVRFLQTGGRTMVACDRALIAGFNTRCVLLVSHVKSPVEHRGSGKITGQVTRLLAHLVSGKNKNTSNPAAAGRRHRSID
jgi:hypothetical protein